MKVLVAIKRVCDPYAQVRLRPDGKGVALDGVKMVVNPFCENALEQAATWKDQGLANEVIAVSAGPAEVTESLRTALARGADNAIHIVSDLMPEPLATAKLLAKIALREQPDVFLFGKQAIDDDCNQTAQMTAALLGWGQALFLSQAKITNAAIAAECEIDVGIECIDLPLPCVLSADLRLNEPRHIALPNILKARKKPITQVSVEDLGVDISPRHEVVGLSEPPSRPLGERLESVASLVDVLKNKEGVL